MKKKIRFKRGISLITLVITIVVIIILAAAVILTLGNNNPISSARKAKFIQNFSTLQDEFNIFLSSTFLKTNGDFSAENISEKDGKILYNDKEFEYASTINDILGGLKGSSLEGKVTIKSGKLVLIADKLTKEEKEYAIDNGMNFKGISIKSREDLEKIVLDNDYPLDGIYDLEADIDLASKQWIPIGNGKKFTGVFDGNNYEISNILISSENDYNGLFYINSGVIKNISLVSGEISGNQYTSGISGINEGEILNCINKANITGKNFVGGICGINRRKVTQCKNYGSIVNNGSYDTGGIIGKVATEKGDVEIIDCSNFGEVNGPSGTAGIVGTFHYGGTIRNCYNSGDIGKKIESKDVGGIIGGNYNITGGSTTVTGCYNDADIKGYRSVAGIVGLDFQNDIVGSLTIEKCYNLGEISCKKYEDKLSVVNCGNYCSGIIGYICEGWKVSECFNRGSIISEGANVAGIIGGVVEIKNEVGVKGTVENCYNNGEIKASSSYGGIIGRVCAKNVEIYNTYNCGEIVIGSSSVGIGNIVGWLNNGEVVAQNCYYNSEKNSIKAVNNQDVSGMSGKTEAEMKNKNFVLDLAGKFKVDSKVINNGYPILSWESN